jgi:hypothetical protein
MRQLLLEMPFLIAAVIALVALGVLFSRSASAAIWTLVGVGIVTHTIVPPVELQVTQGGITLYALDVIAGVMFAIGVARYFARPGPRGVSLPLAVLCALFAIHVVRGIMSFGFQAAVNGSRTWLYVLGPLVFAVYACPRWTRQSLIPLIVAAGALAGYALLQIARHGLYGANEYIEVGGELVDARPVHAGGALLIIQCLLIIAAGRFARSTRWLLATGSMGLAVLLLQHRTIWVVALLAGAIAYIRWARIAIFVNERAAAAAAAAILFVAPVVVALAASSSAFAESVRSATGQNSTLEWRTQSWTTLIEEHSSTEERLFGLPAGYSSERRIGEGIATESAHSVYVESLLSFGVLGPLIVVWFWISIVRRRGRAAAVLGISGVVVALIVASQALFGITYGLGPFEGLLLGMLLQAAWFTSRDEYGGQLGSGRRFVGRDNFR